MDGRTIKYTYGADGKKLRAVYSNLQNIYQPIDSGVPEPMTMSGAEPVEQAVSPNSGGIGPELPVLTSTTIDYCGNLTYKDDILEQMLVDGGYVTFPSNNINSPTYHFYIQDHLGNNRVVVKQDGTVEQVNHYYPYGGLMAESTGHNVQRYKYNGKEFDRMHGLDLYDYGSRNHDPALGRWTTIDPLCEKYYDISPYAYCAGNPILYIDNDGRKFDYSQMSEDDLKAYNEALNSLLDSENFSKVYNELEASDNVFVVNRGAIKLPDGNIKRGQFELNESGGGTITFSSETNKIEPNELSEEMFHAYQYENSLGYEFGKEFNREFEAKTFVTIVADELNQGYLTLPSMEAYQLNVTEQMRGGVSKSDFVSSYMSAANKYGEYNRTHNYSGSHYKARTQTNPYSLLKVLGF